MIDLVDTCLLNIYSLRLSPFPLAPTFLVPGSCGTPQRRCPSMHLHHRHRHIPEPKDISKKGGGGQIPSPFYSIKAPPPQKRKYGDPGTQGNGKISCNLSRFKFPGTAERELMSWEFKNKPFTTTSTGALSLETCSLSPLFPRV